MKTSVIRIGNSRGIRIPKALLEECGQPEEVELQVRRGCLMVIPTRKPRQGWEKAFRRMAAAGDDALLDIASRTPSRWDRTEWEW